MRRIASVTAAVLCLAAIPGQAARLEPIDDVLPVYDAGQMRPRDPEPGERFPTLRLLLSRSRYWREDGHLDAVVRLELPDDVSLRTARLRLRLLDGEGRARTDLTTDALPSDQFAVYPEIPPDFPDTGDLEVALLVGDRVLDTVRQAFRLERMQPPPPTAGRIPLRIDNPDRVHAAGMPMSTGVPFPRGALYDPHRVRLIDRAGDPIPAQIAEKARWSKYGSVKWLQVDFTADLNGAPREWFLEYGDVVAKDDNPVSGGGRRASSASLENRPTAVKSTDQAGAPVLSVGLAPGAFPVIDTGRLRFGPDGLAFDVAGDGVFVRVLDGAALSGAFVEHEDGRVYRPDPATPFEIEEAGPEKIVIRREGWYVSVGSGQWAVDSEHDARHATLDPRGEAAHSAGLQNGDPPTPTHPLTPPSDSLFCRYVTRYVIHRGSPLMRVFHTWIFTGDGNRDRIRTMGWRLDLDEALQPDGFLDRFGSSGAWLAGHYLLQHDYAHSALDDGASVETIAGGRAPGVARAGSNRVRLYLGIKDFWQNYPSELEFADGALWFHNWPRHGKPRRGLFDKALDTDRTTAPALPSAARYAQEADDVLTRSEWKLNVVQARFAHEGEVLDFRLPDAMGHAPIHQARGGVGWPAGDVEAVNAQGISRSEEFWVYLTPADADDTRERQVLEALNEERLRLFPDPAWIARSGVFHELHPRDPAQFPEAERAYEQLALAPLRWVEHLGYYGMWLYGDLAAWSGVPLETRAPWLYRALRKAHHGWPYSWIPYARSGDPRFLKFAEAALRQLIDASYVHHVDDAIRRLDREGYHRRKGLQGVGPLAWAGARAPMTRHMHSKIDSHLAAWYLTDYRRALDNFRCWSEQTKTGGIMAMTDSAGTPRFPGTGRGTVTLIRSYIEAYEATFDPWFLVAAHGMARGHLDRHRNGAWHGHFYNTGDLDFHRFTGDAEFGDYVSAHADRWGAPSVGETGGWGNMGAPMMHVNAYAWQITGDPYYRRRSLHAIDWLAAAVYGAQTPAYLTGAMSSGDIPSYTGWALEHYPRALAAAAGADDRSDSIHNRMQMPGHHIVVAVRKPDGQPLTLRMAAMLQRYERDNAFELLDPGGKPFAAGTWNATDETRLTLPADAPGGVYRWRLVDLPVSYAGFGFALPLTPDDTPEVLIVEPGAPIQGFHHRNQLWFWVPAEIDTFRLTATAGNRARRVSVWNPDGERVWDSHLHPETHAANQAVTGDIPVAATDADRLWRVTFPGGGRIRLDPRIPPVFSIDRSRWFDPRD